MGSYTSSQVSSKKADSAAGFYAEVTIERISAHVHQQSNTKPSGFFNEQSDSINSYCSKAMQWMKVDAAAACSKYRCCQKMVEIYEHCGEQDEVDFNPVLPGKKISYSRRKYQMKKVMDSKLHLGQM